MMVPMLKQHPSSIEVLVVSIVNGRRVDADLHYVFVLDPWVSDIRLIRILSYVIMRYTLIFVLIYLLSLIMLPHVCIVVYKWVHPICYLNRV
jgi:hypothetical protein